MGESSHGTHDFSSARIRRRVISSSARGAYGTLLRQELALAAFAPVTSSNGQPDQSAELAKELQNPVAVLISMPSQNNFEFGGGPNNDGFRYLLKVQPIIPVSISEEWNLISRTIVPFIHQSDMIGKSSQTGLGDILQSAFFSPKAPTAGGLIIYPLAKAGIPPEQKFVNVSGKAFNTIHANSFAYYEEINQLVQEEPNDALDPEMLGLLAAIGI